MENHLLLDLSESVRSLQSIDAIRPLRANNRSGTAWYSFRIEADNRCWTIEKRFSHFDRLAAHLLGRCRIPLPHKKAFTLRRTNSSTNSVNKRFEELAKWLGSLLRAVREDCDLLDALLGGRISSVREEMVEARTNANLVRAFLFDSSDSDKGTVRSSQDTFGGAVDDDSMLSSTSSGENFGPGYTSPSASFRRSASVSSSEIRLMKLEKSISQAIQTIHDCSSRVQNWAANSAVLADGMLSAAHVSRVDWNVGAQAAEAAVQPFVASLSTALRDELQVLRAQADDLQDQETVLSESKGQLEHMLDAGAGRSGLARGQGAMLLRQLQTDVKETEKRVALIRRNFAEAIAALEEQSEIAVSESHRRLAAWQCQCMGNFANQLHDKLSESHGGRTVARVHDENDGGDGEEDEENGARDSGNTDREVVDLNTQGGNERARILSHRELAAGSTKVEGAGSGQWSLRAVERMRSNSSRTGLPSSSSLSSSSVSSSDEVNSNVPTTHRGSLSRGRSTRSSVGAKGSKDTEAQASSGNAIDFGSRRSLSRGRRSNSSSTAEGSLAAALGAIDRERTGSTSEHHARGSSFGSEDSYEFARASDTSTSEVSSDRVGRVPNDGVGERDAAGRLLRHGSSSSFLRKKELDHDPTEDSVASSLVPPAPTLVRRIIKSESAEQLTSDAGEGGGVERTNEGIWDADHDNLNQSRDSDGGEDDEDHRSDGEGEDRNDTDLSFHLSDTSPVKMKPRAIWDVFGSVSRPTEDEMSPMTQHNLKWNMPALISPERQCIPALGLRYSRCGRQGRRESMEDVDDIVVRPDVPYAFFAIFDGHNGSDTALALKSSLHDAIVASPHFPQDMERSIREGCAAMDEQLLLHGVRGGSTAVIMFVFEFRVVVANVGDSEAVLCLGGKPVALCPFLHRPDHSDEAARIEAAGGFVKNGRICGLGLAVSRAFGDFDHKKRGVNKDVYLADLVSAIPSISSHVIGSGSDFIVLGCDGLFDVMSHGLVVDHVKAALIDSAGDLDVTCQRLVDAAIERYGSTDNVSAMMICFEWGSRMSKPRPITLCFRLGIRGGK